MRIDSDSELSQTISVIGMMMMIDFVLVSTCWLVGAYRREYSNSCSVRKR